MKIKHKLATLLTTVDAEYRTSINRLGMFLSSFVEEKGPKVGRKLSSRQRPESVRPITAVWSVLF